MRVSHWLAAEPTWYQRGVIAHELGHVATVPEVFNRRRAPEDEWGSESAADWFAYHWGFGRDIRRQGSRRDKVHHGPLPGETVEIEAGRFRLTRNFVYKPLCET